MRVVSVFAFVVLCACGAESPPEPVEDSLLRVDTATSIGVTADF